MIRFWAFVKKEFLHILRDRRTLMILIGLPVALVVLFGYIISNEIRNVKIAFIDYSNDYLTAKLRNEILSSGYFVEDADFLVPAMATDQIFPQVEYGDIDAVFKKGNTSVIVIFNKDFAKNIEREGTAAMQIVADASDPNTAAILVGYIQGIVNDFQKSLFFSGRESMVIDVEPRMMFNSELKGAYMYVPGTIAFILMLICAIMTSVSITREKEFGSMEVLLVTPLKSSQIILGKLVPYVFLSIFCSVLIFVLGYWLFDVPFKGPIGVVILLTLLFVAIALLLGLWISNFTKTMEVAMTLSLVALMLPTLLLSGFIFPIESMPMFLQVLASIIPPRYFLEAIKTVMLKGGELVDVAREVAVLVFMLSVLVVLNIRGIKPRLE
ncbi:MAG: ABC transporter permease [Bacteroidales bacterium]|nr:ABC transporter permease [Bacteroidales bacterium]